MSSAVRKAQSIRTIKNIQFLVVQILVDDDRSTVSSHNCGVLPTHNPFTNNPFTNNPLAASHRLGLSLPDLAEVEIQDKNRPPKIISSGLSAVQFRTRN